MNIHRNKLFTLVLSGLIFSSGLLAQLTPAEVITAMQKGINMGNTLEPPYEGDWGNGFVNEAYFDHCKNAGFDAVRIPVRWDNHTGGSSPYTINQAWMDRVEEVVDWGLEKGFYIVLNAHHDNWIKDGYTDPVNRARFDSIWSQISLRFSDKSEKLVYEILNEPHGLTETQNNELHHRVLDIIRLSNPTRNVIVQGNEWGGSNELLTMDIPDDPYIIGSFHSYDPWPFGLQGTGSFGSSADLQTLDSKFKKVHDWSKLSGIPVFLGEFACHQDADYNSWSRHYRAYTNLCEKYGFAPFTWDDGGNFKMMYRSSGTWKDSKDILIYSGLTTPTINYLKVEDDTLIRLKWNRGRSDFDSITLEHKTERSGSFTRVATLGGDATEWADKGAEGDKNHYYRIVAYDAEGKACHSNPLVVYLPAYFKAERGYYLGYAHPVPGTIEAEDFDYGGEGDAYHENDHVNVPGNYRPDEAVDIYDINSERYVVGNMGDGEWMEYSIHVEKDGLYRGVVYYSSMYDGGRYILRAGEENSGEITVVTTRSWVEEDIAEFDLLLEAGEQILRFEVISDPNFMVNKFDFKLDVTGIGEDKKEAEILVRQLDERILLENLSGEKLGQLRLISLSGRVLEDKFLTSPTYDLHTHGLSPGIYLLQLTGGQELFQTKILLQ